MLEIQRRLLQGPALKVAHRGASFVCPENTMPAFTMAAQLKADMIELDVQLTRDGEAVVMHDPTIDRTTDGHGRIADLSFADLSHLDAGRWKSASFAGTRIPRLQDVLTWLPAHMYLNIEIKGEPHTSSRLVHRVLRDIYAQHRQSQILISSFNHEALALVRHLDPQVALGALICGRLWPRFALADELKLLSLHPQVEDLDRSYVQALHDHGLAVVAWTLRSAKAVSDCRAWGIDALIADDLTLLRSPT